MKAPVVPRNNEYVATPLSAQAITSLSTRVTLMPRYSLKRKMRAALATIRMRTRLKSIVAMMTRWAVGTLHTSRNNGSQAHLRLTKNVSPIIVSRTTIPSGCRFVWL